MKVYFIAMISIRSGNIRMNFKSIRQFDKDFKKLSKRYKSLSNDLNTFKKNIPFIDVYANKNFAVLHKNEQLLIIKARFFCRYLKGRTLRLIYAHYVDKELIEFIQLYFKGDSEEEDKDRIKNYLNI